MYGSKLISLKLTSTVTMPLWTLSHPGLWALLNFYSLNWRVDFKSKAPFTNDVKQKLTKNDPPPSCQFPWFFSLFLCKIISPSHSPFLRFYSLPESKVGNKPYQLLLKLIHKSFFCQAENIKFWKWYAYSVVTIPYIKY